MKKFFSVKNWDSFQHYKDRNPPWIKLHNHLLDDYEFECLGDSAKGHLLCIWMLASRTKNEMPLDEKWIAKKIGASGKVDLNSLIEAGFLVVEQDASNMLHNEEQGATVSVPSEEKRRDREEDNTVNDKNNFVTICPHQKIIDAYHEKLPMLPRIKDWSDGRRAKLKTRWSENKDRQNIEWWNGLFEYISKSDFLTGKKTDFKANLEWIVSPKNFIKIIEGHYDAE